MTLTRDQLAIVMPKAAIEGRLDLWLLFLNAATLSWGIVRRNRLVYFCANVAEETGELKVKIEGSYFNTPDSRIITGPNAVFRGILGLTPGLLASFRALGKEGFDEAFFNHVYNDNNRPPGSRGGNTQAGDGFRFRGRGPMQLTWRHNYEAYFNDVGLPIDSNPDLILEPEHGAMSAARFVATRGCNALADQGAWSDYVLRINGAQTNMEARVHYRNLAEHAFADISNDRGDTLCIGDEGPDVVAVQRMLPGVGTDGDFGRQTRAAVIHFQRSKGLSPTGAVDPTTRGAMGL